MATPWVEYGTSPPVIIHGSRHCCVCINQLSYSITEFFSMRIQRVSSPALIGNYSL